jgi:hypothetical protein
MSTIKEVDEQVAKAELAASKRIAAIRNHEVDKAEERLSLAVDSLAKAKEEERVARIALSDANVEFWRASARQTRAHAMVLLARSMRLDKRKPGSDESVAATEKYRVALVHEKTAKRELKNAVARRRALDQREREANSQMYDVSDMPGTVEIPVEGGDDAI